MLAYAQFQHLTLLVTDPVLCLRWLKVGDDAFGREMVLTLNTNGVQTRGVKIAKGLETGVSKLRLTCGTGSGVQMKCEIPSAESMLLPKEINLDIMKEVCGHHLRSIWISSPRFRYMPCIFDNYCHL